MSFEVMFDFYRLRVVSLYCICKMKKKKFVD
jgi:hypothetical protein